ncbi:unnamed protein product, partial [Rotaria sp. Silwood1]
MKTQPYEPLSGTET